MHAYDATVSAYSLNHFCRSFDIGRSRAYLEIASGRLRVRKVGRRTLEAREVSLSIFLASVPAVSMTSKMG